MEVEQQLVCSFLADYPDHAGRELDQLPLDQAAAVLSDAPPAAASRALASMSSHTAARCLEALTPEKGSAIVQMLPVETATILLRRVALPRREALMAGLQAETGERLELMLRYPEDTAGAIMDPLTATIPDDITVKEARRRLHDDPEHLYYYTYVVDRRHVLVGVVGLRELFMAHDNDMVRAVMHSNVTRIPDRAPISAIVVNPGWKTFHALPVVSDDGVFLGMIRYRTLQRLAEEAQQDGGLGGFETIFALGELYWTGLVELFGGMSSGGKHPRKI